MKNRPFWWLADDSEWEIVEYDHFMKQTKKQSAARKSNYIKYTISILKYICRKVSLMDIPCCDIHFNMARFWNLLYEVDAQTIVGE